MEPYDAGAMNDTLFSLASPIAIKQEPMGFNEPFSMLPNAPATGSGNSVGFNAPPHHLLASHLPHHLDVEHLSGTSSGNSSPMSGSGLSDSYELEFPPSPTFMQGGVSADPYALDNSYADADADADAFASFADVKMEALQPTGVQRSGLDRPADAPPSKRSKSTGGKPKGRGKAKAGNAKSAKAKAKANGNTKVSKAAQAAQAAAAAATAAAAAATAAAAAAAAGASPAYGSSSGSAGEEKYDDEEFDIEPFDETGMTPDEIKKKKRMLKNRQSASLSRKRKKEYLEGLEAKNTSLLAENNKLKTKLAAARNAGGNGTSLKKENAMYKTKCEMLQRENEQLKLQLGGGGGRAHGFGMPMRAGGTVLMACLLCVGLFANPFAAPANNGMVNSANVNGNSHGVPPASTLYRNNVDAGLAFSAATPAHTRKYGRTLKTVEMNEVAPIVPQGSASSSSGQQKRRQPKLLTGGALHAPAVVPPSSQDDINADEQTTLEGWIAANEARVVSQLNLTLPTSLQNTGSRRVGGPSKKAATSTELDLARQIEMRESTFASENPWQLPPPYGFEGFDGFPSSVARRIQRRADTSYLFCSQVHMVAATDAKEGANPKLAIVMPASKIPDQVLQTNGNSTTVDVTPVLQVDCDVTGTNVVQTVRSGSGAASIKDMPVSDSRDVEAV